MLEDELESFQITYPAILQERIFDSDSQLNFAQSEWRVLESIYNELTHELNRLDEMVDCQAINGGAFRLLIEFKTALDENRGVLMGATNKDEECCLVCGDADYQDDNLIGYCDTCGLSVHNRCYGQAPEVFWKEFICYACAAFTKDYSMLVECVMCHQRGGAIKPLDCTLQCFKE